MVLWGRARLSKLEPERRAAITERVRGDVAQGRPIRLINNFGGLKSVRAAASPHIDWAEVLHLAFVRRWLLPICAVYEPGVEVEYTGQGAIGCLVDNIPWDRQETYEQEFSDLIAAVRGMLPENFVIAEVPFEQFYARDTVAEMFDRFSDRPVPDPERAQVEGLLDRAAHNFMWDGREDLTELSSAERTNVLRRSVWNLLQWYAADGERRGPYFSGGLAVTNGVGGDHGYSVRAIAGTDKAFWMAEGVLNGNVSPWRPELRVPDDPALASSTELPASGRMTTVAPGLDIIRVISDEREGSRCAS